MCVTPPVQGLLVGRYIQSYCYSDSVATRLVLPCFGLVNIVVYAKQWHMGILPW